MTNQELADLWSRLICHAPADAGPVELKVAATLNEPVAETIARLLSDPDHEIEF